ncbi:uncharacterized protein LOC135839954 isoform X2 [Planococcus citri]|uniref:uncharacterized protein LOC135839954 isoform X2 n=1 Tax=Planococcus citri TaxID=170843 RepID=UPI0031F8496A
MEVDASDLELDNSSEEELFVFNKSVSTLQDIASHAVALQLWHHYLSRAKCGKIQKKTYNLFRTVFNLNEEYERESVESAELLKTPKRIEEMLKKSLRKICYETKEWINLIYYRIFSDGMRRYCPSNFDPNRIVWRQNDEIDYKMSASNILTEEKLNAEQKFIVMCAYGMSKELESFPMNSLPEFFCLLGISNLKVAYWISYHRHDLREIWVRIPDVIRPEDPSIHVTMAMECANRFFPYAFEYFWSRLNEDERTLVAGRILPQCWKLLKIMLSTMPSFQQLQLVDQIPVELLSTFFISNDDEVKFCRPVPENVLIVWTLVKDRITEQQFDQFLENVCDVSMKCEEYMTVLIKVWDTASDRLKRHIVENRADILFNSFMRCDGYSPSSYKFFMKFLPLVNEHTRKELYLDLHEYEIASKFDIDILNLCLPEEVDQLQLRIRMMDSGEVLDYCAELLKDEKFDEAIAKVTLFSRNPHDVRKFLKEVLESSGFFGSKFITEYETWNKLSNFIDSVFANDFSTISMLKKRLVSSLSFIEVYYWNKKKNVEALVQITEQVFSPEEMKSFKKTLLEDFQKQISSPRCWPFYKGRCFNAFVSWCSSDENQIVDFKSIIRIDAFFDETFRDICSTPDKNPEYWLHTLDEFLRYVCVSNEEVKLLKIRKYYERDQYWIRQVDQIFGWATRRQILDWFRSDKTEKFLF